MHDHAAASIAYGSSSVGILLAQADVIGGSRWLTFALAVVGLLTVAVQTAGRCWLAWIGYRQRRDEAARPRATPAPAPEPPLKYGMP